MSAQTVNLFPMHMGTVIVITQKRGEMAQLGYDRADNICTEFAGITLLMPT